MYITQPQPVVRHELENFLEQVNERVSCHGEEGADEQIENGTVVVEAAYAFYEAETEINQDQDYEDDARRYELLPALVEKKSSGIGRYRIIFIKEFRNITIHFFKGRTQAVG